MLTIYGIDKLRINTFVLGDKINGPNEYWEVKDVLEVEDFYEIRLKCNKCSPASPILGTEMTILLNRKRSTAGEFVGGYRLHCIKPNQYRNHLYVSPNDMKAPGEFVKHILHLLNKN